VNAQEVFFVNWPAVYESKTTFGERKKTVGEVTKKSKKRRSNFETSNTLTGESDQ
jgi:hypothetical protein